MMTYYDQVAEAAAYLKERLGSLGAQVGMCLARGWERRSDPSRLRRPFLTAPSQARCRLELRVSQAALSGTRLLLPLDRSHVIISELAGNASEHSTHRIVLVCLCKGGRIHSFAS